MTALPASRGRTRRRARARLRWRRAGNATSTALLMVVAAVALLTVVLPLTLRTETHTVLTGSMRPGIEPGALVAVRDTPISNIRVGDVVTYQLEPGRPALVTHRVVGFVSDADGTAALITRGDANSADDPPVLPVQVRGVVVYVIPWAGYPNLLINGMTRSSGVIVLGVIVIGYGAFVLIRDILRGRRRARGPLATAAVVCALLAGIVAPPGPAQAATGSDVVPSPAPRADADTDALQLSRDGESWTEHALPVFPGGAVLVPGEIAQDALWVRNTSDGPARVDVVFSWQIQDDAEDADAATVTDDVEVRAQRVLLENGEPWEGPVIAAGDELRVDLTLGLDPLSGNASRRGDIRMEAAVVLAEHLADPVVTPSVPLAATGGWPPVAVALVGVALVGWGLRLAWPPRRRRAP